MTSAKTISDRSTISDGVNIIWLDTNANSNSDDSSLTRQMLHQIHPYVIIFDDPNICLNFIGNINNKNACIFLVVSGKLSTLILSKLENLFSIDSVFIFCGRPELYKDLVIKYSPRVIGAFSERELLKSSLETELNNYDIRTPVFNFFAQKQNAIRDLTYDAASFLWFRLLQKVLIKNHYDKSDMQHMIEYCRKYYERNHQQKKFLPDINEFEKNYKSTDAIKWYTRQSFVYKLINTALRTEDITALYIFRFYISDLCRALVNEHQKFRIQNEKSPVITLYRGSHITSKELDRLRDSIGGMTSINGFISTTMLLHIAEGFAARDSHRGSDTQKVLWIIEADCRFDDIIFAPIVRHSQHFYEEEVLFIIGTSFLICDVTLDEVTNTWHVKASATDAGEKAVKQYMQLLRCELNETSEKVMFGMLLIDMGKYLTAQSYFQDLISRFSSINHPDLADFHYNMALTYNFQGDHSFAEKHFLQALEYEKLTSLKPRNMVRTLNALGWLHQETGELSKAIEYYRKAESVCSQNLGLNDLANAQTYTYMGRYFLERQQYNESNAHYEHALQILRLHSFERHQRFAIILNEMGDAKRKQGESYQALELYQQAETIFHDKLPHHHPCMAYCWSGIGLAFLQLKNIEEAQHYHRKALETYRRVLPPEHINISISEKNLKCITYKHIIDGYLQVCAQV